MSYPMKRNPAIARSSAPGVPPDRSLRADQSGAVLFVALIMLLLLTLLGVTAMQVTVLQERMAGNLRTQQQAFENTEWRITDAQNEVRDPIFAADHIAPAPVGLATTGGDLPWEKWLEGTPDELDVDDNPQTRVRYCVACPAKKGAVWGEDPARKPRYYIVSGVGFNSNPDAGDGDSPDTDSTKDAVAVLQSVYVF
jgi:hypothetical protein